MTDKFIDIDSNYDTNEVSKEVEKEMDNKPKTAFKTTSFYTLIAAPLVLIVVGFLLSHGIITPDMKDAATSTFTEVFVGVIGLAVTYLGGKFIEGRSAVTLEKTKAAIHREFAQQGLSSPYGYGRVIGESCKLEAVDVPEKKTRKSKKK